jgi:hypothetical protein
VGKLTTKPLWKSGYGCRTAHVASDEGSDAGVGRQAGLKGFKHRVQVCITSLLSFRDEVTALAGGPMPPAGPGAGWRVPAGIGVWGGLFLVGGLPRLRLTGCAGSVSGGGAGGAGGSWG